MKVAILWGGSPSLLAETMENLITSSQVYLFTVICNDTESTGARWVKQNGLPINLIFEDNPEKLLEKIVKTADFLVAYNDGNQYVRRLIMMFKAEGKHGKVVSA